jgi:hypothetical protein
MGSGGFWKNKLLSFIKGHRLEFPWMKITAVVECEVIINGEVLHFTMPIVLSKDTKKHARELMYGEVYDGLLEHFNEKDKENKKNKKKSTQEKEQKDKGEIDNKRLTKSTGILFRKSQGTNVKKERLEQDEKEGTTKIIKFPEIEESNIGFKLLEKLGWVKGEGINGGMKEPIQVVMRKKNAGLGT